MSAPFFCPIDQASALPEHGHGGITDQTCTHPVNRSNSLGRTSMPTARWPLPLDCPSLRERSKRSARDAAHRAAANGPNYGVSTAISAFAAR